MTSFFITWQQISAETTTSTDATCKITAANINKYPAYDGPVIGCYGTVSKKEYSKCKELYMFWARGDIYAYFCAQHIFQAVRCTSSVDVLDDWVGKMMVV